jgi:two-component system, cell cycle response regulator DivK
LAGRIFSDGNNFRVRILIVEDNPVNLDLVMQLLEDDYELLTAEDGQSGYDLAVSERPDLLLLDLSLPKRSGWDVCTELRQTLGEQVMPIVALTAHAIKGDREKALLLGFDDYITKPIDENLLFQTVEKYLARTKS